MFLLLSGTVRSLYGNHGRSILFTPSVRTVIRRIRIVRSDTWIYEEMLQVSQMLQKLDGADFSDTFKGSNGLSELH